MTPNDEQMLAIKQYLKKYLKYRETKDEMFDHIITALEHTPDEVAFGEAMNNVIGDIGGLKGIALIENAAKWAAVRAMLKRYIETLREISKSTLIIFITVIMLSGYYLINRYLFSSFGFSITMMLMINIPNFALKRSVMKKPNLDNVKNDAFRILYTAFGFIVPVMMLLSLTVMRYGSVNLFLIVTPYIATVTFSLVVMHSFVLYKLIRQEFFQAKLLEV